MALGTRPGEPTQVPWELAVIPWFVPAAIQWYANHLDERLSIGTPDGHERLREASKLMGSSPAARTDRTRPQPIAPSCSDTSIGPRTFHGPTLTPLKNAKETLISTTQCRERKTSHPCARSRHIGCPAPRVRDPEGSRTKRAAATR